MKRYILLLGILAVCILMSSCCNDGVCLRERPEEGKLRIEVNNKGENGSVPVTIFSGTEWENGDTLWHDNLTSSFDTTVPTGKTFSARAVYRYKGEKVVAHDAAKVEVKKRDRCDDDCFRVNDGDLDLRLLTKAE